MRAAVRAWLVEWGTVVATLVGLAVFVTGLVVTSSAAVVAGISVMFAAKIAAEAGAP